MQDLLAVQEDEIRGGPVAPGRYTLDLAADGIAASRTTIDVLDGQETAVEILLRPGFPARITIGLGSSHPEANQGRLVLVDASGATASPSPPSWRRCGES
jgi:hypothetical protein